MARSIGIDIGTSKICAAVTESGVTSILKNKDGYTFYPAALAKTEDGYLVGNSAVRQTLSRIDSTDYYLKRKLGALEVNDVSERVEIQDKLTVLFKSIRSDAENALRTVVHDCVVSVPACFRMLSRDCILTSARAAGFESVRLVSEQASAALVYSREVKGTERVMIVDFGGGMLTVSLAEITGSGTDEATVTMLSNAENPNLGGIEFTRCIVSDVRNRLKEEYHLDVKKDKKTMYRLEQEADRVKKELSSSPIATFSINNLAVVDGEEISIEYDYSRVQLERFSKDLIDEMEMVVQKALVDANLEWEDISAIILVGGTTRIPAVADRIRLVSELEPSHYLEPQECVAAGASMLADTLFRGEDKAVVRDVAPMNVLVKAGENRTFVAVEKNQPLPCELKKELRSGRLFSQTIQMKIYEGNHLKAEDNVLIRKIGVRAEKESLLEKPASTLLFKMDESGMLHIEAKGSDLKDTIHIC